MDRSVAIVGVGSVTPTCSSTAEFAEKVFSNQSLVREWPEAKRYEKQLRSKVAGYIEPKEIGLERKYSDILEDYVEIYVDKTGRLPEKNLSYADLSSVWAMLATKDAIKQAGWNENEVQSNLTGVIIGSGAGGNEVLRPAWKNFFELGRKSRSLTSHNIDRTMVYRDAANVACFIKNRGIVEGLGSACASGLGNIGYAYRMIKHGYQERCIAGGTEGTSIETFVLFDAMQVLSRKFAPEESSRPFDKSRNGFVCSFGCGVVALESLESAKSRGATILAVIDGYHNNSDGTSDMFAPSYGGQLRLAEGLFNECKQASHHDSNIKPEIVKAHGSSTPVGDIVELMSIIKSFGKDDYHISAPKSQCGHMLGAAGAVELVLSVFMLQNNMVSPCLNSYELSNEIEPFQKSVNWDGLKIPPSEFRHLIPEKAIEKEVNSIVCLNYGFGGTNAAMKLSKYLN